MENGNLKNMVILKNLPSNIVDEAILVLKSNKKIRKLEKIEQNRNKTSIDKKVTNKDYILKEAQMIVNNYISKIESKEEKNIFNRDIKQKYEKLRKYAIIATIICAIQSVLLVTF